MELVVLLMAGVALVAVYYAVTAVTTWWDGFRNRQTTLLRVALLIAVVVVLLVLVIPESATVGPVVDVAIGVVVALVLLGIVGLAVLVWRRPRRQALGPPAVPKSKRPLVERRSSGRNSEATASRPPPLVERRSSGTNSEAPRSQRPLVERRPSGRNSEATASRPPPLVERSEPRRNTEHSAPRSRRQPAQRGGSRWKSVYNPAGREQLVYAFGAFDNLTGECRTIKLGVSTNLKRRQEQVQEEQVARTHTAKLLGSGPGGEQREKLLLGRLHEWRYPASEWLNASPEVLAEVAKLEQLTADGRRLTEEAKRSA